MSNFGYDPEIYNISCFQEIANQSIEYILKTEKETAIQSKLKKANLYELRFIVRKLRNNCSGQNIDCISKKEAKIVSESQPLIQSITDFRVAGKNKSNIIEHLTKICTQNNRKSLSTIWNLSRRIKH